MGYILGISCGFHDSAACLIKDGVVLGACEEERFTGIKHDYSFPKNTINWLYENFNITKDDITQVAFYDNPKKKLSRIKWSTLRGGIFNYFKRKEIVKRNTQFVSDVENDIKKYTNNDVNIYYCDHHLSHVAYSFYTSPFKEAVILSVDGVGEWETTTLYHGQNNELKKIDKIKFPNSLGMLYSTMTAFLGFKPNEGEYKVMGLAPYGDPLNYLNKFKKLYKSFSNGKFKLNMKYFTFDYSDRIMFNYKLPMLLGMSPRNPKSKFTQKHKDLAATVQSEYEYLFFKLLNKLQSYNLSENICLSGGCAYNGTANGKILKDTKFKNLWIPPAPSDAGSSIGAALHLYFSKNQNEPRLNNQNPYLGPQYTKEDIIEALKLFEDDIDYRKDIHTNIINNTADYIKDNKVVGWFEGRMEFGARALGNRSILANPRDPNMKRKLNAVVKKREGFRPFAPIVLKRDQNKYFQYDKDVLYMNQVVQVRKQYHNDLPAITHIDGSARIQTLDKQNHFRIYRLLERLKEVNEHPIVLNTSFNLKDQTMVLDPKSAIQTFLNCDMDALVIENYFITKK